MKRWFLLLLIALAKAAQDISVLSPDELLELEEEGGEEDLEHDEEEDAPYDPQNEPAVFACRRDPTWKSLNFEECQELTGWYEDGVWTKGDESNTKDWLNGKDFILTKCLEKAFANAKTKYDWAKCDEESKTEICEVEEAAVLGHYFREGQGKDLMSL